MQASAPPTIAPVGDADGVGSGDGVGTGEGVGVGKGVDTPIAGLGLGLEIWGLVVDGGAGGSFSASAFTLARSAGKRNSNSKSRAWQCSHVIFGM